LSQANADFNYELTPDDHDEEFTTGRADHLGLLGYWVDLGDLVHVGPWATNGSTKIGKLEFYPTEEQGAFLIFLGGYVLKFSLIDLCEFR
jgi:hypothetical protein